MPTTVSLSRQPRARDRYVAAALIARAPQTLKQARLDQLSRQRQRVGVMLAQRQQLLTSVHLEGAGGPREAHSLKGVPS